MAMSIAEANARAGQSSPTGGFAGQNAAALGMINHAPLRTVEHYALGIINSLPVDRAVAIDALERARAMVEAMHNAA